MKNAYTEILEQIITEMKTALFKGSHEVIDSDYRQWLNFLKQIHPDSALLKDESAEQVVSAHNNYADPLADKKLDTELKEYSDIRAIIQLAVLHEHPTWYIQPHFTGSAMVLNYENGALKNVCDTNGNEMPKDIKEIPLGIIGFTGMVTGIWANDEIPDSTFVAYDLDTDIRFPQKMERLQKSGFTTPDFVLFPTDKLITISSSKLETSLAHFISTAQTTWAKVDGVVIVSDTPLFGGENGGKNKRIIYKSNSL